MTTWLVIVAVGLGSFAIRALPLLAPGRWADSPRVEQLTAHAGTAAMAALATGALRRSAGSPVEAIALAAAAAAGLVLSVRGASLSRVLLVGGATYAATLASVAFLT